jgi:hypothetical protein
MESRSGALRQYARRVTSLYRDHFEGWPSILVPRRSPVRRPQRDEGAEQRWDGEGGSTEKRGPYTKR